MLIFFQHYHNVIYNNYIYILFIVIMNKLFKGTKI